MRSYLLFIIMMVLFNSCGGGGGSTASSSPSDTSTDSNTSVALPAIESLSFTVIDDALWNELAVKKVLDTFAYGGHASDAQISTWADMAPKDAIVEMLNNQAQNTLLSPTSSKLPNTTSLESLASFWSGSSSDNFLVEKERSDFESTNWSFPRNAWKLAVLTRGLNPFLHRVGFWESNYHMSINRDSGVYPMPMAHHYDNILRAISEDQSYDKVIAQGAKNAGVAYQYGHNKNVFEDGQFKGNEDFAREYHQLFLGILGTYDHEYHESTTIPYTARALTDMSANWNSTENGGPDSEITFGSEKHYSGDLKILKATIPSSETADTQLDAIATLGIEHEESLNNLPLMIIRHFADDNLSSDAITRIQESWKNMSKKSLISFLQAYAISTDFHSSTRYKYKTSIERTMSVANLMVVDNSDHINNFYSPYYLGDESVNIFRPIHDVFGHQTSLEASENANIFKVNYNRSIQKSYIYTYSTDDNWKKDWAKIIPKDSYGEYKVKDVGLWLWKRFIGDGGKNYQALEQAHITALLNGKDLGLFLDENNPLKVYSQEEIESGNVALRISDGSVAKMNLGSSDADEKKEANERIGLAIAFIVATPYIYAQEGI